jgi:hypothetical protein
MARESGEGCVMHFLNLKAEREDLLAIVEGEQT